MLKAKKRTRTAEIANLQKNRSGILHSTAVTFSADELEALGDYIAAGLVMLRVSAPNRAVSKLKAAMSRLKISSPRGL